MAALHRTRADQSDLLYPLVTDDRLDLMITHIVVLDDAAWRIAGNDSLDDDRKIADVPQRVVELSPPVPLRQVMKTRPWVKRLLAVTLSPHHSPTPR
jgi:hypothetical protein